MNLLTSDQQFSRRARQSGQYRRIRWEPAHILRNPDQAIRVLYRVNRNNKGNGATEDEASSLQAPISISESLIGELAAPGG
jgi:hypothetical protein